MTPPKETLAKPQIPQPTFTHRAYGVDVEWFGGEGGMAARGHVPELRFIAACNHLARTGQMRNVFDEPAVTLDEALARVTRCWAVPVSPMESDDEDHEWFVDFGRDITEQTPGAIAITVLDV